MAGENSTRGRVRRNRTEPKRYGNSGKFDDSKSDTDDGAFSDNSVDDENFEPLNKKQKKWHNLNESNEHDLNESNEHDLNQSNVHAQDKDQDNDISILELNEEYEDLISIYGACTSQTTSKEIGKSPVRNENDDGHDNAHEQLQSSVIDNKLLMQLHKNTVEILARLAVIEETLIKNKVSTTHKVIGGVYDQNDQKYKSFIASNGLPLKTVRDVDLFEEKLSDEKFFEETVSIANIYACIKTRNSVDNYSCWLYIYISD